MLMTGGDERKVIPCCPYPRTGGTLGNSILLVGAKHRRFPYGFFVGPDWMCLVVTYTILILPTILIINSIYDEFPWYASVVAIILCIVAVIALSFTACSDPGIIPKLSLELANDMENPTSSSMGRKSKCRACNVYRPRGAIHCDRCNTCCEELDHHCPWTGKCIGKYNLKYFYSFLVSLCLLLGYIMILTLIYLGENTTKINST